ncbi:MAG: hypothetical protein WC217_02735 [Candidatus Paceibacterota bacterium]
MIHDNAKRRALRESVQASEAKTEARLARAAEQIVPTDGDGDSDFDPDLNECGSMIAAFAAEDPN